MRTDQTEADRGRSRHDISKADGGSLEAEPNAKEQAPESAGRPGKVSPQSQGGNAQEGRGLGRGRHEPGRADDAASPARLTAKDGGESAGKRGLQMMARLVRMHGGRGCVREG